MQISAPRAVGGYSQGVAIEGASRLLFISGQIPERSNGIVPTGFEAQAHQVWGNVLAQLEAASMSVANLVKVTIFLSSRQYADANGRIRREYLANHSPALTVIITGIFDEQWLLEIEAVAGRLTRRRRSGRDKRAARLNHIMPLNWLPDERSRH